jgi:2-amino-4-hydroxy-6-hydroxymethyldihydropteridine diphosphokinase
MPLCLIGLGSNLGNRQGLLDEALVRLQQPPSIVVARASRYRQTQPVGGPALQSDFLNAVAVLDTSLSPRALLAELQKTEAALGRQRVEHWGPRAIDLDLLLYDDLTQTESNLVIPHPRMAWRRFVLEPAAEAAPEMVHPSTGWTIARLLDHLNRTPWYVAIAGPIGVGKSCLARKVADNSGARLLAEELDPARLEAFYRNPSRHAWQIELEFLEQRARQLDAGRPEWSSHDRPMVSDYWFGQSPDFASVWLDGRQAMAYRSRWDELRSAVVRPRLTALLRAPIDVLMTRIQARRRPGEELLTPEQLQRIEHAIENQSALTERSEGPVLRLDGLDTKVAEIEVTAAVAAMR